MIYVLIQNMGYVILQNPTSGGLNYIRVDQASHALISHHIWIYYNDLKTFCVGLNLIFVRFLLHIFLATWLPAWCRNLNSATTIQPAQSPSVQVSKPVQSHLNKYQNQRSPIEIIIKTSAVPSK